MFQDKKVQKLFKRVKRLKQKEEIWEATTRKARVWVTSDGPRPYRPSQLLVVDKGQGMVLKTEVTADAPTAEEFFVQLLETMRSPSWFTGGKRRPSVLHVDDEKHVAALTPWLAQFDVGCEYRATLPVIDQVAREMEKQMKPGRKHQPGLLKIPGMTPPLIGHIYDLASQFYQLAPWRWMDDESVIEIRFPTSSRPRYAVVMGSNALVYGLAIYDSFKDLQASSRESIDEPKTYSTFVIHFGQITAMNFDDLDAQEKYDWPVAEKWAYPIFFRGTPDDEVEPPSAKDLFWTEAALAAMVKFVREEMQVQGFRVWPTELTMPVETISGEKEVYLRVPVDV